MRSSPLFLLCLLWSLVEVHSQTVYPYVDFMETTPLPNHTYIDLNLVGEEGDVSVRCRTDLSTCCNRIQGIHRGDWIPPGSEESLPLSSDTSADIYQVPGAQRVRLRRRNNGDMPSGIYRCDIPTIATHDDDISVRESVYVGLYATGGIIIVVRYHVTLYKNITMSDGLFYTIVTIVTIVTCSLKPYNIKGKLLCYQL